MLQISIVPAIAINYLATYNMYLPYIRVAKAVNRKNNINGRFRNDNFLQNIFYPIY